MELGYKYFEKRNGLVPHVKVYLGGPFFNLEQKKRVDDAAGLLDKNKTISVLASKLTSHLWSCFCSAHC